ncbi:MAG: HD domain-containing protein [Bacteriovoracaceae bacterium]|nr:HD domain-containing protein [Bacteriovoracaceae bacterium]
MSEKTDSISIIIYASDPKDVPDELRSIADVVKFEPYDLEKMMDPPNPLPSAVACLPPGNEISTLELAQTLRMVLPDTPLFFLTTDKATYDKKKLIKNGFNNAFLLPWEKNDFGRALKAESLFTKIPELRDYCAVQVLDLHPGKELDFGLRAYLPLNGKLISVAQSGEPISESKLNKIKENSHNTLFVHKDDIDKFYQYTAARLTEIGREGDISETERKKRMESGVRELVSDMFIMDTKENTFGKSKALLEEMKNVIKLIVKNNNPDILSKLELMVNSESDFYSHLSNTSTYAALFGMALAVEKPEELALAGLLHDVGVTGLPLEAAQMNPEGLTPTLREAWEKHPKLSIDIARMKRMALSERVMKAIVQHHEKLDGSGFPDGLTHHKITSDARILAIADAFDDLTSLSPGRETLSPAQAMEELYRLNTNNPMQADLDIEILRRLRNVLNGGATS